MKKWRVTHYEGTRNKYYYTNDDFKAIKRHIENLGKHGLFGGARLYFRIPDYKRVGLLNYYLPVGGCDCLLGLTYRPSFLGKSKEYWEGLIKKAKAEVRLSDSEEDKQ